jgi:hypothetical protein
MKVYLVPAGSARLELYCEVATPPPAEAGRPASLWGRLVDGFKRALAEGEEEERRGPEDHPHPERGRIRRWVTRKLAEAVAEMRLLWHLRAAAEATLVHPDDLDGTAALAEARREFGADLGKHRRWTIIDAVVTIITGPLFFFVPGPNVVSWYFAFRAVGHFYAMQGAQQGLSVTKWSFEPSAELTAIRGALDLPDAETRGQRLDEISAALGLERLCRFVERVAGDEA